MKLQELLETHKDKLWDWRYNNIELDDHIDVYFIDCDSNWFKVSFSLSDLLFSTPFLSLLEWDDNKCDKVWIHQYMKWWKFVEWYSIYEQYHKINLVLLTTDIERIKYVEEFTL